MKTISNFRIFTRNKSKVENVHTIKPMDHQTK